MSYISPFLVVNADEVLFDHVAAGTIMRLRVPRPLIDQYQGRKLDAREAADLVRARMTDIGRAMDLGELELQAALSAPLLSDERAQTGGRVRWR